MFPSAPDVASVLLTDLGLLTGLMALSVLLDRSQAFARALFGLTAGVLIANYAAWRWHDTLPRFEPALESLWPYLFFGFEAIAITYTLMSIVILLRRTDRSAEADAAEARLQATGEWPAVDIFICTYNEPLDVLEKSIIPALAIDYPRATVWVLDDTRREWLRSYCEEVGARYLTRPDNRGAKAGNLNNALHHTAGVTNAPIILVLDADFAPQSNILRRTVGLFSDPKAAVVQTPQFFFNSDPIQHNLKASRSWVDDQRIFFDVFQPAKDGWGCAFCVGTSFLVRRDRLEEIGGFPDQAICEDINLTYTLMPRGYETHWLNERLSVGLSAEGLPEYITQRTRWCLGTIQVAFLRTGPFLGRGYTLTQRLHYLHGVLNWLCKPFIVLMLLAPSLYWFAGLPAFHADYLSFMRYGVPALLALWIYSGWVSGSRTLPLFMEVTHALSALAVTVTLLTALVKPFGRPFKVTDKGGDRSQSIVRWRMAAAFGGIAALSGGCIIWSMISPSGASEVSPIDTFNLIWAGVAMVFAFVSFLVCFERPRGDERFGMDAPTLVDIAGQGSINGTLVELSTTGATLRLVQRMGDRLPEGRVSVFLDTVGWIDGTISAVCGADLSVNLEPTLDQRRKLIIYLFARPSNHIANVAKFSGAFRGLMQRCFGTA